MRVFHKITNKVFDVSMIEVFKQKRLFCLLDTDTKWNLNIHDTSMQMLIPFHAHSINGCIINFRMSEQECDRHIDKIHAKQAALNLYNKKLTRR